MFRKATFRRAAIAAYLMVVIFARSVPAQAGTIVYGSQLGSWNLAGGLDYNSIESSAIGDGHGAPYVVGVSQTDPRKFALVVGSEINGAVTFSGPIWAPPLGNGVGAAAVFAHDLVRDPIGGAVIIGTSSVDSGYSQGAVWNLNSARDALVPTLVGASGGTAVPTTLFGGDGTGNYAGGLSNFAAVNDGGTLVTLPRPLSISITLGHDRYGDLVVGQADAKGAFWTRDSNGEWHYQLPSLPDWSDGINYLAYEAGAHVFGGSIFNPQLGDALPIIWNSDGSLNSVLDLPGYTVSEIINDHGLDVVLLNGTGGSYLWSEGWDSARPVYGPGGILGELPFGVTATVFDLSSGGSQWLLTRFESGAESWFATVDVATSVSSVPEPGAFCLMFTALVAVGLTRTLKHSV